MPENFDPTTHFTPEEYARIRQPVLEREAARARAAAKRAAVRGDDAETLIELRTLADKATLTAEENHDRLTRLRSQGKAS